MLGRATPTMETSSPSRNRTPHKTRSVIQARRSKAGVSADGEGTFMTRQYMQLQIFKSKLILAHECARVPAVSEIQVAADPVASWRELNAAHAAVQAALEHELRHEHDLSTIEFEVLD